MLVKSTLRVYGQSKAVTELKEFAGRGHSLTIDSGWRVVAETSLAFIQRFVHPGAIVAAPMATAQTS